MNDIERAVDWFRNLYNGIPKSNLLFGKQKEYEKDMNFIAIQALEKQIPKKIFHEPWVGIDGVPYDLCPNCETNLCTTGLLANNKDNYCPSCGQKLDWSGEDE